MAENAGRLEIEVVAKLDGFREKLRAKVDEAAEGITAKIGIEVDSTGLRERLEATVKAASRGVQAKVGVAVTGKGLREQLERKVEEAQAGLDEIGVRIRLDGGLRDDVREETEEAQAEADAHPVDVPVREDGSWFQRFLARLREARAEGKRGVDVDVREKKKGGGFGLDKLGGLLGKLKIPALLTVAQPLIAVIDSLGSAAYVLAAGLAQAAGSAAVALPSFAALGQGVVGFKLALGGVAPAFAAYAGAIDKLNQGFPLSQEELVQLNAALNKLSPSARKVVVELVQMRPAFRSLRREVQEAFFSQFADQIKPLIQTFLPILRTQLTQTGRVLGQTTSKFIAFARTPLFRSDFKKIGETNNVLLGDFGQVLINLARIFTRVTVAAGPLARHVADLAVAFTDAKAKSLETGAGLERLQNFFDRAGRRAGQVYRILRDFTVALVNIGSVALGVDDTLKGGGIFATLERVAARFRAFTESTKGKNEIAQYFRDILPLAKAVGGLINAAVKGFIKVGDNNVPAITKAVQDIQNKVGPALGGFLSKVSSVLGPKLLDLLSSIADLLSSFGDGKAGAFNTIIGGVIDAITGLANFLSEHKTIANTLGGILGAILAFKVLKGASKFSGITSLASALGGLGRAAGALKGGAGLRGALGALTGNGGLGGTRGARGVQVYWTSSLPVYITGELGGGGGGGGGLGDDLGGGGEEEEGGRRGRGRRGRGRGRFRGRGRGRIRGLAGRARGGLRRGIGRFRGGIATRIAAGGAESGFLNVSAFGRVGATLERNAGKVGSVLERVAGKSGKLTKVFAKGGKLLGKGGLVGIVASVGADFAASKIGDGKRGGRDALAGALSGAATGAGIGGLVGSVVPVVGTGVGAAVGGVIGGAIGAAKNSDLPKVLGGLAKDAGSAISGAFDATKTAVSGKIGELGSNVAAGFKTVKQNATALLGPVAPLTGTIFKSVTDLATGNLGDLGKQAQKGFGQVKGLAREGFEGAKTLAGSALVGLNTLTGGKLGDLGTAAQRGFNKISGYASEGYNGAKTLAKTALDNLGIDTDHGLSGVVGSFKNLPGKISSALPSPLSDIVNIGTSIVHSLFNGIVSASKDLGGILAGAAKGLVGAGKDIVSGIGSGFSSLGGFLGFRADGGDIRRGGTYIVGEHGPEIFQAGASGFITDNSRSSQFLRSLRGSAGGRTSDLGDAQAGGVHFHEGAIQVINPAPEPASTSIEKRVKAIGQFGLFGGGTS